jgi:hypothetical protein
MPHLIQFHDPDTGNAFYFISQLLHSFTEFTYPVEGGNIGDAHESAYSAETDAFQIKLQHPFFHPFRISPRLRFSVIAGAGLAFIPLKAMNDAVFCFIF